MVQLPCINLRQLNPTIEYGRDKKAKPSKNTTNLSHFFLSLFPRLVVSICIFLLSEKQEETSTFIQLLKPPDVNQKLRISGIERAEQGRKQTVNSMTRQDMYMHYAHATHYPVSTASRKNTVLFLMCKRIGWWIDENEDRMRIWLQLFFILKKFFLWTGSLWRKW